VWSKGPSPVTTRLLGHDGGFCCAISCGGVAVQPGDAVLADENGVLILAPQDVRAEAQRAIEFQTNEQETLARLRAGEKFPDIVGSRAVIDRAIAAGRAYAAAQTQGEPS
jgi:regulator of RNase E activity RraA